MNKYHHGFTLIELLIVIVILGVLSSLIVGNFINSIKKGDDTKRKTDLEQIRKAIELYYEDNKVYPAFTYLGNPQIPPATEPTSLCINYPTPNNCSTGNGGKVYMQKLPTDTNANCYYRYETDGLTWYKIYSYIENTDDNGPGVKIYGYHDGALSCGCGPCRFAISSPNTDPDL